MSRVCICVAYTNDRQKKKNVPTGQEGHNTHYNGGNHPTTQDGQRFRQLLHRQRPRGGRRRRAGRRGRRSRPDVPVPSGNKKYETKMYNV